MNTDEDKPREIESKQNLKVLSPNEEAELAGAKLIFGDKLVDPKDRRVCRPHSRKPAVPNPGSNLQTFEHRPGK